MSERRPSLRKRSLTFDASYDGGAEDESLSKGGHSLRKRARIDYARELVQEDADHLDRADSKSLASPTGRTRKRKVGNDTGDEDSASAPGTSRKRRRFASAGLGSKGGRQPNTSRPNSDEPRIRPEHSSDVEVQDTIEVGFARPDTFESTEEASSFQESDSQESSSSDEDSDDHDDELPAAADVQHAPAAQDYGSVAAQEEVEISEPRRTSHTGASHDHLVVVDSDKAESHQIMYPADHESFGSKATQKLVQSTPALDSSSPRDIAAAESNLSTLYPTISTETNDSIRSTIEAVPESLTSTGDQNKDDLSNNSQPEPTSPAVLPLAATPVLPSSSRSPLPRQVSPSSNLLPAAPLDSTSQNSRRASPLVSVAPGNLNEADDTGDTGFAVEGGPAYSTRQDGDQPLAGFRAERSASEEQSLTHQRETAAIEINNTDAPADEDLIVTEALSQEAPSSLPSSAPEKTVDQTVFSVSDAELQQNHDPAPVDTRDNTDVGSRRSTRQTRSTNKGKRKAERSDDVPSSQVATSHDEEAQLLPGIDDFSAYLDEDVYYPMSWEEEVSEVPAEPVAEPELEPEAEPGLETTTEPLPAVSEEQSNGTSGDMLVDDACGCRTPPRSPEDYRYMARGPTYQRLKDRAIRGGLDVVSARLENLLATEPWRATGEDPPDAPPRQPKTLLPLAADATQADDAPSAKDQRPQKEATAFATPLETADLSSGNANDVATSAKETSTEPAAQVDDGATISTPRPKTPDVRMIRTPESRKIAERQEREDSEPRTTIVTRYPKNRYKFRKIRDPFHLIERLKNYKNLSTEDLREHLEIAANILNEWQLEYNESRKNWEDEDNAVRRQANDKAIVNWENRLRLDQPPTVHRTLDEPPKGPPPFAVRGIRAPKPFIDDDVMERQRENDKVQALAYGFRHNNHPSKIGAQDPEEQRYESTGTRLRERKQTQRAVEAAEDNLIVIGKRTRKQRVLSDDSRNASRAGTPAEPVRASTRGRRRVAEADAADDVPQPQRRRGNAAAKLAAGPNAQDSGPDFTLGDPKAARNRKRRRNPAGMFEPRDGTAMEADAEADAATPNEPDDDGAPAVKRARAIRRTQVPARLRELQPIPSASFYAKSSPLDTQSAATDDSRPSTSSSDVTAGSSYSLRHKPRQNYRDTIIDDFATEPKRRTTRRVPPKKNGNRSTAVVEQVSMAQAAASPDLHTLAPAPPLSMQAAANGGMPVQERESTPLLAPAPRGPTRIKIISRNPTPQPLPHQQPRALATGTPNANGFGMFMANGPTGGPPLAPAPYHQPILAAAPDSANALLDVDLEDLEASGRILTKSEKMSLSMKRRWANGGMDAAVAKRKATLARKKQEKILKKAEGGATGTGATTPSETPELPPSAEPEDGAASATADAGATPDAAPVPPH